MEIWVLRTSMNNQELRLKRAIEIINYDWVRSLNHVSEDFYAVLNAARTLSKAYTDLLEKTDKTDKTA